MSFSETLVFALHLVSVVFLAAASYALRRKYRDHRLSVTHISPTTLTLHGVQYEGTIYSGTYTFKFTSAALSVRFHWPTRSRPRWLTFVARDIFYSSTTCDISMSALDMTLWFFPLLFKQTAGPWASVVLDGFRIRVHRSSETPIYVKRLRQNVVGAVLTGEILRVDDFQTSMQFAGLSDTYTQHDGVREHGDDTDSEDTCDEGPAERIGAPVGDTDELCVSALARQLHINNEGRMYTFGAVDAQLRRDWNADRGTFVMVAEESRWVRVHWAYQREATGWWAQLATSVMQFPLDVHCAVMHPLSAVDLYIPRLDITFDDFRIRDAELLVQAFSIVRQKMFAAGVHWGDFFLDAAAHMIAPS